MLSACVGSALWARSCRGAGRHPTCSGPPTRGARCARTGCRTRCSIRRAPFAVPVALGVPGGEVVVGVGQAQVAHDDVFHVLQPHAAAELSVRRHADERGARGHAQHQVCGLERGRSPAGSLLWARWRLAAPGGPCHQRPRPSVPMMGSATSGWQGCAASPTCLAWPPQALPMVITARAMGRPTTRSTAPWAFARAPTVWPARPAGCTLRCWASRRRWPAPPCRCCRLPIAASCIGTSALFLLSGLRMRLLMLCGTLRWLVNNLLGGSIGGSLLEACLAVPKLWTISRLALAQASGRAWSRAPSRPARPTPPG